MKILSGLFLVVILLFYSCSVNSTITKEKTDIELLKELAFCQCLERSQETFSTLDTLEMGRGAVLNLMDSRGLFPNIVQPIFDSLAF